MDTEYLSWAQKSKISNQKDIYVTLRTIMFLKMCRGIDKISEETFRQQMAKLKKKYQLFTSMIPNFDLLKYCQQFKIPQQQIQGALSQLEGKIQQKDLSNKSHFIFVEITALFIEVADFPGFNVGEARLLFDRLLSRLTLVEAYFKNNEFSDKVRRLTTLVQQNIGSKPINENLTEQQLNELKLQVRGLFDLLAHLTRG